MTHVRPSRAALYLGLNRRIIRRSISRVARRALAGFALVLGLAMLTGCGVPAPDTPLTIAVERDDTALVRTLLTQGADPDKADGFGLTPLCRAARRGRLDVVQALLAGGAKIDLRDQIPTREGWTPLMNAVHKNRKAIVEALLAGGANVNVRTSAGMSALALASGDADAAIVLALLGAGADPDDPPHGSRALTNAVAAGRTELVKALLARAPGLRVRDGLSGKLALWAAKMHGRKELLTLVEDARGR